MNETQEKEIAERMREDRAELNKRRLSEPQYCHECMKLMTKYVYLRGTVTFVCDDTKGHLIIWPDEILKSAGVAVGLLPERDETEEEQ